MNKVKFYIQKTMKKINNFEHLKHYFERLVNEDHFYFVQVLRRKKDDGQPPNFHVIRNYHLFSEKEFEKNMPGIIELCESNNARAYFWVNPRDAKKIALETSKALIDHVVNQTVKRSYRTYDHICGKIKASGYDQLWIVDVDDKTLLSELEDFLSENIVDVIETAQGCHLITKKFNTETFHEHFKELIDIHKDNPTLLYYAENGRKDL